MSIKKHTYASSAAVRRAISTMERAGFQVGSVKFYPDRTIELLRFEAATPDFANDFDRYDAKGLL